MHAVHRVTAVEVVGDYVVRISFDDDTRQVVDLEPVLAGEIYGPLRSPTLFAQVSVDPEVHTIVWPNGADFDPAILHDWPVYAKEFARRAQTWEPQRQPAATR